jgi:hypothetical protein
MVFRISCCLQIILSSYLFGGEYYLTYSLTSKHLIVSGEKTHLSKAIVPFANLAIKQKTTIENIEPYSKTESDFVREHIEEIVSEVISFEIKVSSTQKNLNEYGIIEKTQVKIAPIPIRIEFNEDFVTINILQE